MSLVIRGIDGHNAHQAWGIDRESVDEVRRVGGYSHEMIPSSIDYRGL